MRGEIAVLYACAEHLDSALRTDLRQPVRVRRTSAAAQRAALRPRLPGCLGP